jgi:hypothetical protein
MTTTQLVIAGVIVFVIICPALILLNPPTAWVDAIWGGTKRKKSS